MGWTSGDAANAEHLDCELHGVAGYLHGLKFPDLTPHTIHRAGLVRMGKLQRSDALAQDLEERAGFGPPAELESFLKEMGMTRDQFLFYTRDWKTITRFRSVKPHRLRSLYHKLTKQ
jgi:hypothetical protein